MFLFSALGQFFNGKIINNLKLFLNWPIVFSSENSTKGISKTISTSSQITLIFSKIPWIAIIRQNQCFLEKKLYFLWICEYNYIGIHQNVEKPWEEYRRICKNIWKSPKISENFRAQFFRDIQRNHQGCWNEKKQKLLF